MLRGHQEVARLVKRVVGDMPVGASVVSVAEVYQHIFPKEISSAELLFASYILYPVELAIARSAGLYWQEYQKKFQTMSLADCLIAATVRQFHMTLLTFNTRHFPMTDITVRNPRRLV